jgi:putative spermidine/putrescine transport system permease protein
MTAVAQAATRDVTVGGRRLRPGTRIVWWAVFIIGCLYFLVPLLATLEFALRPKPFLVAFTNSFGDPKFVSSLIYSVVAGLVTILVSISLLLPTAYWVRLRTPRLRPFVEFVTLLPFVIPAITLVFGLLRLYSAPPLSLTSYPWGSDILLVASYTVLSLPYMYRAIDSGLRAVDIQSLTEAAQSLGAGWPTIIVRVILPNVRVALLSGAFLTLAIAMGEFTFAQFFYRPAFGPYLSALGRSHIYEPAAVAFISFLLTWAAMGMLALIGRRSRTRVAVVAAK